MQKEVIFAIILGSGLGLLVAFGVFRANSALKEPVNKPQTTQNSNSDNNPNTPDQPSSGLDISLSAPLNNSVVDTDTINIAGVTNSEAIVIVSTQEGNWITIPANSGSFEIEVEIAAGFNQINVTSILRNGEKTSDTLNIVLTTQLEQEIGDEYKPMSFIGGLTDITENSLQIRTLGGEIVQVSLENEEISYANIVSNSKEISFDDLAIGDFIIAIGTMASNNLLEGERILVTTEPEDSPSEVALASATEIEENYTTNRFTDVYILDEERNIEDFDLDDIEENSNAIAVFYTDEDEDNILETVLVLPIIPTI